MTRSQVFLFLAAAVLVLAVMRSSAAPMYPDERLPRGNTTEFAIARGKLFTHVFARGKDGQLWYRYQPTSSASPNWTDWQSLPAPEGGRWDSDPAVGVNADGSLEVFVRWSTNLDLWQYVSAAALRARARVCAGASSGALARLLFRTGSHAELAWSRCLTCAARSLVPQGAPAGPHQAHRL